MEYRMSALVGRGLALSLTLFTNAVLAQNNPEQGDVRYQTTTVRNEPVATTTTTTSNGPFVTNVATSGTDHSLVVGHLGVGHFGILNLPYATGPAADDAVGTLDAPTIGARYWLDERIGIEAALGIGLRSGGTTVRTGNTSTEISDPGLFGLALHGGLPIVFATSSHFAFQVIPELNFGFVSGGREVSVGATTEDLDLSGLLLQIGARAGAEIQFGFIGIPQLALQATVGLHLTYTSTSASIGQTELSRSNVAFGTTLQNTPWDIFRTAVAAIYYF